MENWGKWCTGSFSFALIDYSVKGKLICKAINVAWNRKGRNSVCTPCRSLIFVLVCSTISQKRAIHWSLGTFMFHRIWYAQHILVKNTKFYLYVTLTINVIAIVFVKLHKCSISVNEEYSCSFSRIISFSGSIKIFLFLSISILLFYFFLFTYSLIHFLSSTFLLISFSVYASVCSTLFLSVSRNCFFKLTSCWGGGNEKDCALCFQLINLRQLVYWTSEYRCNWTITFSESILMWDR